MRMKGKKDCSRLLCMSLNECVFSNYIFVRVYAPMQFIQFHAFKIIQNLARKRERGRKKLIEYITKMRISKFFCLLRNPFPLYISYRIVW